MWAVTEDRIEAERRIFGPGPEGERGVEIPLQ
jgi:hypothetical protein